MRLDLFRFGSARRRAAAPAQPLDLKRSPLEELLLGPWEIAPIQPRRAEAQPASTPASRR